MREITALVEGYRAFLGGRYPREAERYRDLAERGQSPETMIVACCDSRVDPATIFSARPGELFVVRNVANLVPPYEPIGGHHGTSAALEFAVLGLQVKHIVVMGHARCGGIRAFLDDAHQPSDPNSFIVKWMGLMKAARGEVLRVGGKTTEAYQAELEHNAIRHSLENLKTFPFVRERLEAGRLSLHGAFFDVATGQLLALDTASGAFEPVA